MSDTPIQPDAEALLAESEWLRGLARHLVRDPGTADDVAQDAAIAGWLHPPAGERRPWLARVARNFARQRHRSASRRERREGQDRRADAAPSPAQVVERVETHRVLAELVAGLAEPNRTSLVMRYYEGLEPREIARRLGVPAGTVRARVHRGLAELRERLDARHRGERSAWLAALAPLAGFPDPPRALPVGATAAAVVCVGVLGWLAIGDFGAEPAQTSDATPAPPAATSAADGDRKSPAVLAAAAATPPVVAMRIRGRVIAPHGAFLDEVVVVAEPVPTVAGDITRPAFDRLLAWTTADAARSKRVPVADGAFDADFAERAPVRLTAAAPGLASEPLVVDGDRDDAQLVLEPTVRHRGRVLDEKGEPIAGARAAYVTIPAISSSRDVESRAVASSDESGRFALEVRDATPLAGADDSHFLLVTSPGFAPVTAYAGDTDAEIGIVLPRGGIVTGRVTQPDGTAACGVLVTVAPALDVLQSGAIGVSATTAADGSFRVGPVGEAAFRFFVAVRRRDGTSLVVANESFPVPAPLDLRLPAERTARGRIVEDGTGAAVAGLAVAVRVRQAAGPAAWLDVSLTTHVTGADGTFEFVVPDAEVVAYAEVPGPAWSLAPGQRPIAFGVAGRAPPAAEWRVTRGVAVEGDLPVEARRTIRGTVENELGRPVAGAEVVWNTWPHGRTVTAADGSWSLDGVRDGLAAVVVRRAGHAERLSREFGVGPSATTVPPFVLAEPSVLRGVVVDDAGAPIPAARVVASGDEQGMEAVTCTGADGRFELGGFAPGPLAVWVERASISCLRETAHVETPCAELLRIVLRRALSISGRLTEQDGRPVGGVMIRAVRESDEPIAGATSSALTDGTGAFSIDGLAEGLFELRMGRDAARGGVAAGTSGLVWTLAPARPVRGVVLGPEGTALAGVRVIFRRTDLPPRSISAAEAWMPTADAEGRFEVTSLRDGVYTLVVDVPQFALGRVAEVPPGDTSVEIRLVQGREISGIVVDADGRPVAGANVTAKPRTIAEGTRVARSGPDGRFTIGALADGEFDVQATALVTEPKRVVLRTTSGPVATGATDVKLVVVPLVK